MLKVEEGLEGRGCLGVDVDCLQVLDQTVVDGLGHELFVQVEFVEADELSVVLQVVGGECELLEVGLALVDVLPELEQPDEIVEGLLVLAETEEDLGYFEIKLS